MIFWRPYSIMCRILKGFFSDDCLALRNWKICFQSIPYLTPFDGHLSVFSSQTVNKKCIGRFYRKGCSLTATKRSATLLNKIREKHYDCDKMNNLYNNMTEGRKQICVFDILSYLVESLVFEFLHLRFQSQKIKESLILKAYCFAYTFIIHIHQKFRMHKDFFIWIGLAGDLEVFVVSKNPFFE